MNNIKNVIWKSGLCKGYISYKHLLLEWEPKYIDKYTTAYNSDIVRAILSHQ